MKIAVVVVTYNRLTYLKKCILALHRQSRKIDTIYVINNGSTDGTTEWLETQTGLTTVNQDNTGGAGGFYRGLKEAFHNEHDLIWAMDDDVNPTENCLETLIQNIPNTGGIACPRRLMNGKTYISETLHFNFKNPFASLKKRLTTNDMDGKDTIPLEDMAFEGPLISSSVIAKIGLPEKGLFIFWDDSEYAYRAFSAGFPITYCTKAILIKEDIIGNKPSATRSWKYPYTLRNEVFFIQRYATGWFRLIYTRKLYCRYMFGLAKHLLKGDNKYTFSDFYLCHKAFRNGMLGILGKF